MTIATYSVKGMSCEHCVRAVDGAVSALPGVDAVNVDLEHGQVTVTSASPLDRTTLAAAIDEAGYELAG